MKTRNRTSKQNELNITLPLNGLQLNMKYSIHLHNSTFQEQQYTAKGDYATPLEDRNHESCN